MDDYLTKPTKPYKLREMWLRWSPQEERKAITRSAFSQKRFWRNSTVECGEFGRLRHVGRKRMCGQNPKKIYLPSIGMDLASTSGCDDGKLGELNFSRQGAQGNLPWSMKWPDTLHELLMVECHPRTGTGQACGQTGYIMRLPRSALAFLQIPCRRAPGQQMTFGNGRPQKCELK